MSPTPPPNTAKLTAEQEANQTDEKWNLSSSSSYSPTTTKDRRLITTVRVVAHNQDHLKVIGTEIPNTIGMNHWSIYLLMSDKEHGDAVRVHVRLGPHTDPRKWHLLWSKHEFTKPLSALGYWDWKVIGTDGVVGEKGICPEGVEKLLLEKKFNQFKGDHESEQGCRWWILKTIELFGTQGWIDKSAHIELKPHMLFCYLSEADAKDYNNGKRTYSLEMVEDLQIGDD